MLAACRKSTAFASRVRSSSRRLRNSAVSMTVTGSVPAPLAAASRRSVPSRSIPVSAIVLSRELCPETISTPSRGIRRVSASRRTTAAFALPPSAGALTRTFQPAPWRPTIRAPGPGRDTQQEPGRHTEKATPRRSPCRPRHLDVGIGSCSSSSSPGSTSAGCWAAGGSGGGSGDPSSSSSPVARLCFCESSGVLTAVASRPVQASSALGLRRERDGRELPGVLAPRPVLPVLRAASAPPTCSGACYRSPRPSRAPRAAASRRAAPRRRAARARLCAARVTDRASWCASAMISSASRCAELLRLGRSALGRRQRRREQRLALLDVGELLLDLLELVGELAALAPDLLEAVRDVLEQRSVSASRR